MSLRAKLFIQFCLLISALMLCEASLSAQGKFICNAGQWNPFLISKADISGGAVFLCRDELRYNFLSGKDMEVFHNNLYSKDTISIHNQAFFFQWIGANQDHDIKFQNESSEYYNFYIGNDPKRWKSGVKGYSDVNYINLYKGINLNISADATDLEYTYSVAPGADPSQIQVNITGADSVFIRDSNLHIYSTMAEVVEKSPNAYQVINGEKVNVPCFFEISEGIESFSFPSGYDHSLPLIIDPLVIFSTYSGSYASNLGFTGTFDNRGNAYGGGIVFGSGFPTTPGAYQTTFQGGTNASGGIDSYIYYPSPRDIGLLKFTPDGSKLIFATYLGGTMDNEQPSSLATDKNGNLFVFGTTTSSDFPVTSSAYQTKPGGASDMFISKFSPDGKTLLASTFMGGSSYDGLNGLIANTFTGLEYNYGDQFRGELVLDDQNNVYVASSTFSNNFPVTSGCYQAKISGGQDGCVFKMDSNLHSLIWSTYLGGAKDDGAYSLALDASDNIYTCGGTYSPFFFKTGAHSYQDSLAGDADGFICLLKKDGSAIIGSTYIGTSSHEQAFIVRVDNSGFPYVFGQTENNNFPVKNVKYSNPSSGDFVVKYDKILDKQLFSSVFGAGKGKPDISPSAFFIDNCGRIYVSGWGGASNNFRFDLNMPVTFNAFQATSNGSDFYLAVFESNMDSLLYGTYFGGLSSGGHVHGGSNDFDKNGVIYHSVCASCDGSSDFPTTTGAWSRTNNAKQSGLPNCNNALFKISMRIKLVSASFTAPEYSCQDLPVEFHNTSHNATGYLWDFGDGSPHSTDTNAIHKYKNPGIYTTRLVAYNPSSCDSSTDTVRWKITIYQKGNADFTFSKKLCSSKVFFQQTGGPSTTITWTFGDGTSSRDTAPVHNYPTNGTYKVTLLVDSGTTCADTHDTSIFADQLQASFNYKFETCNPENYKFYLVTKDSLNSWLWQFPFSISDTFRNPFFDFGKTGGTYTVSLSVVDSIGCRDTISKLINVYPFRNPAFKDTLFGCDEKLYLKNTSSGVNSFKFYFSDGTTSIADSLVHQFPKDSFIWLKLITDSGAPCADTIAKSYKFNFPIAAYSFSLDTCSSLVLFTNNSKGANSYLWKFGQKDSSTSQNATYRFATKGQYSVKLTAVSDSGCVDSASHMISIENSNRKISIPNIFTPNGDAYNNTFNITDMDPCSIYELTIYNRWGQEFYHATGTKSFTWNGIFHGIKVPEGVYYYVLKGRDIGQMTGTITVVY